MVRLYHGTTTGDLQSIRSEGLWPSSEPSGYTLTDDRLLAVMWAETRKELGQGEGNPVVLTFEVPDAEAKRYLRFGKGEAEGEVALKRILPAKYLLRVSPIHVRPHRPMESSVHVRRYPRRR